MSINITVHGSPSKRSTRTKILLDPEGNKKRLLEERRKLRLEQVRQKSKEFASQVRKNVDNEKQKQLKKIEQIKKEELKKWKRNLKNQLNDTIPEIGEAHRAAKKDLGSSNAIFHNINSKESLDLIPAVPNKNDRPFGKNIKHIYNADNKENSNSNIIRKNSYPEVIIEKSEENTISSFEEIPSKKYSKISEKLDIKKNTKNSSKVNTNDISHNQNYKVKKNDRSKTSKSSFNEPPFKSYASFKERMVKKSTENLKKTPSIIMSLGSSDTSLSSSTSSLEIQDIHDETNQHFSRIYSKNNKDVHATNYNSKSFLESKDPTIKTSRTKFTQISDFLKKNYTVSNRITERNEGSSSVEADFRTNKFRSNILSTKTSSEPIKISSNMGNTLKSRITEKTEESDQINNENSQHNTQKSSSIKNSNRLPNFVSNSNTSFKTYTVEHKKSEIQQENSYFSSKTDLNGVIKSYDYNNRFQKNINPIRYATVVTDKALVEPNAVENADIERQLQKTRDNELEIIKRKTEERGQKALEREKVRRDYEMLESKLEALTKDKQLNVLYSNPRETVSEAQLKQMENERINKINKSIENVIKRPVVITLPEVKNNKNPSINNLQYEKDDLTRGINLATIGEDSGTINSTDSCCSILLNYVDNQTKQINNDIKKSDTNQKTAKLKELLNKLEVLRENLLKELEKREKSTKNKNIQTMFDSITDLREEREKILLLNSEKKDLEKREKELIKREVILENKLKEFYDMKKTEKQTIENNKHKTSPRKQVQLSEESIDDQHNLHEPSVESLSQNEETHDESSECIEKKVFPVDKPLEILIKVKEPKQKTPYKAVRKKASLYQKDIPFRKKYNFQKASTPVRVVDNSEFTSSTVYKSPPETMRTKLDELIEHDKVNKEIRTSKKHTEYETLHKCKDKILKEKKRIKENVEQTPTQIPIDQSSKTKDIAVSQSKKYIEKNIVKELRKIEQNKESGTYKVSKKTQNPILAQYIQRLLGMSRHSINMLGVSSSDIQTPNSSVVNVTNNISSTPTDLDNDQNERIRRIQNFIDDNYSFVNEIEETLKREEKSACESEESIRLIEEIWKKSLKHKTKITKLKDTEPPKPILKKKIKKKKTEVNDKVELINKKQDEPSAEEQVIERYAQLTENCTQRISELNEMIERVRKEKQKILEITLSSNGSANSKTEYLDFMGKAKTENGKEETKKTVDDKTNTEDLNKNTEKQKVSECAPPISSIPGTPLKEHYDSVERVQLEKNKLTGVSRDSGISLSRPVTALDNRDSPDIRDKIDEMHFEPFLKDIPKPNALNANKPTVINMASISITKQFAISSNNCEQQQQFIKKNKPPVSISRYSPQLVEDVPHELSTILEIDTPATSRLNVTLKESINTLQNEKIVEEESQQKQQQKENVSISDETHEFNIDFQKYPSFEDYAKAHNMDIEQFDAEKSAYIKKLYEELFELTQGVDINLKKFPSINSFQNQENSGTASKTDNDSFINLSKELAMKKFLTPKEYFKKIGANDLLDSKSFIENSQSKSSTLKNLHPSNDESSDEEFSKQWCLKKFPELKEYLKKTGISGNTTIDSFDKTTTNKSDIKDKVTNLTKTDSDESLPDVNAELKRRNIIQHSFKDEIFFTNSDPKTSSNSDLVAGSSSSKENKDPTLYIKAKSTGDISGIDAIASSHSSDELGKEFEEMGLKWASLMLKKQQQSNALSSSTSSSFVFQKRERKMSTPRVIKDSTLKSKKEYRSNEETEEGNNNNSTDTNCNIKFGKPLNLREFLTQELQKRTNNSSTESTSLTDDSLASLFLRSLLGSATPSPKTVNGNDIVAGSSDRQQKTSTPVLLGLSSSSIKSTSSIDSNGMKLFSGESRISSVRFNSESSASNDDKNKN